MPTRRGRTAFEHDVEPAVRGEGQVVLADLVVLGKVGIVVVLAVGLGESGYLAVQGQAALTPDRRPCHSDGHAARKAAADGADVRIGRIGRRLVEQPQNILCGCELRMDFQADDGLVSHGQKLRNSEWRMDNGEWIIEKLGGGTGDALSLSIFNFPFPLQSRLFCVPLRRLFVGVRGSQDGCFVEVLDR